MKQNDPERGNYYYPTDISPAAVSYSIPYAGMF